MLIEHIEAQGYSVQETPKSRYIRSAVPLFGGQYALDILQSEAMIRLLTHAQIRKGLAYTLKQLTVIADPKDQISSFYEQMKRLAARGVWIRGYSLRCPICDLETWYGLDSMEELMRCQGCYQNFQIPLELEFSYRPNRLVIEGMKGGALTVLLTLNRWLHDSPITIWNSALEITGSGIKTDIDLIAQREDGLWMAECKDHIPADEESLHAIIQQVQNGQEIAKKIGATYIFATVHPKAIPTSLESFLNNEGVLTLSRSILTS